MYNTQNYWVLGLSHFGILAREQKTRCFGNWTCFRPQVKGGGELGNLERADLTPVIGS
jgi:hypothetical protein